MTGASAALVQFATALRAAEPVPNHRRIILQIQSYGAGIITEGERWLVESLSRLSVLTERQWQRLRDIEARVEVLR